MADLETPHFYECEGFSATSGVDSRTGYRLYASSLLTGASHFVACTMVLPIFPCGTARARCTTPCTFSSARRLNRLIAVGAPGGSGDGSSWIELVGPSRNGHEPRALAGS